MELYFWTKEITLTIGQIRWKLMDILNAQWYKKYEW